MTINGCGPRKGLLYSSEQLGHITDAEMLDFVRLGLRKIYDLRSADERTELLDRFPDGVVDVVVDVLADQRIRLVLVSRSFYIC